VVNRISVDWKRNRDKSYLKPALNRFRAYPKRIGLKDDTVTLYIRLVRNYLENIETDIPSQAEALDFYNSLHERNLSKSAINNFAAAIIKYQVMIQKPVKLHFMRSNNSLPYYFDQMDILRIFNVCNNIKHLCMLKVLFFGCLRSGELCNLDVVDYDPTKLTLRLRETKNGSDAIAYINDETARDLNRYLQTRPSLNLKGREPLFILITAIDGAVAMSIGCS
jgi:integrase/recombinase XerD